MISCSFCSAPAAQRFRLQLRRVLALPLHLRRRSLQCRLDLPIVLDREQRLEDLLPIGRTRQQQFLKHPLRQHYDLSELIHLEPEQTLDVIVDFGDAVFQHRAVGVRRLHRTPRGRGG